MAEKISTPYWRSVSTLNSSAVSAVNVSQDSTGVKCVKCERPLKSREAIMKTRLCACIGGGLCEASHGLRIQRNYEKWRKT